MKYELFILSEINLINQDTAISQRISNYCKALSVNSISIAIINLKNKLKLGNSFYENLSVLTNENNNVKNKNKIKKLFALFYVTLNLINIGEKIKSSNNRIIILRLPTSLAYDIITVIILKKFYKNIVYLEKNELKIGFVYNEASSKNILKRIYQYTIFPLRFIYTMGHDRTISLFDGIIAISTKMEKWAKKYNSNVIRIPILVDCEGVNTKLDISEIDNILKIGFTGSISIKKEGIYILFKSLLSIIHLKPKILLNLYGSVDKTTMHRLNSFICHNGLIEFTKFHGLIPHSKIGKILQEQDLLIMSRPSNVQTNYGFSTKLAEYLASGKATLVTRVSDNEKYITDGVNGYIVEPDNEIELTEKLKYIIQHTSELSAIGIKGRETALKHFDYRIYSTVLTNFLFQNGSEY